MPCGVDACGVCVVFCVGWEVLDVPITNLRSFCDVSKCVIQPLEWQRNLPAAAIELEARAQPCGKPKLLNQVFFECTMRSCASRRRPRLRWNQTRVPAAGMMPRLAGAESL